MSDRERDKDRRKKRTSLNQYLMYLHDLEEDEIFRSGTIPKDVEFDYITKKWEKLAEKLNTCDNGPSMTPDEWKKRLNDWKNSTRCKFRRSQNGEKGIAITALEKKALALFGTAPYAHPPSSTVKIESKSLNTSATELDHDKEVESMLQEVEFTTEEDGENNIIVRKRSISLADSNPSHHSNPKSIKLEKKIHPTTTINKKTIIFDFDASDENLEDETAHILTVEDMNKTTSSQKRQPEPEPINVTPKKIDLAQSIPTNLDPSMYNSIAYQLKRIADVKEEKLMFEIAKYKFNNPGFKYEYHGTAGNSVEEGGEDVLVNVYSEDQY